MEKMTEKDSSDLSLLYDISRALGAKPDLKRCLQDVFDILAARMNTAKGMITIMSPGQNEVQVEIAHGIGPKGIKKGTYGKGEGITGRVFESGKPVVIPRIADNPMFLDRTGSRDEESRNRCSFICVPILHGNRVIGTLSADIPIQPRTDLKRAEMILSVTAAMIANHAVHLERMRREQLRLREENRRLKEKLEDRYRIKNIIGYSNKMREVFQMIAQVAKSNATVLIRGESGTGKELVANAIHYNSKRASHPFVKVNCAALPSDLIESELFGHEKGAFTGAYRQKTGKFELAHKGTVFLDEIGTLPSDIQAKLLRVLQEKEFERVGGTRTIKINVRIIAATNRNLEEAVAEERFRSDLYYRLNVFPIYLPPLREKKTDIPALADFFLEKYARENKKKIVRISTSAIDMLMSYHWPGNVRELENCIERAVLLCEGNVIHSHHLPPTLQTAEESGSLPDTSLETAVARLEKDLITDALKHTRGNMTEAAAALSTTLRKISYKIRKYGIDPKIYR